jgi:hypothetical protein
MSLCLTNYSLHHENLRGNGCIERELSASCPYRFSPGEGTPPPGTHWIKDRVDTRAGLDNIKK